MMVDTMTGGSLVSSETRVAAEVATDTTVIVGVARAEDERPASTDTETVAEGTSADENKAERICVTKVVGTEDASDTVKNDDDKPAVAARVAVASIGRPESPAETATPSPEVA